MQSAGRLSLVEVSAQSTILREQWTISPPASFQLGGLLATCIFLGIYITLKPSSGPKMPSETWYTWGHIIFDALGAITSFGCALLTSRNLHASTRWELILICTSGLVWVLVAALRLWYLLLPRHRASLHHTANTLSIAAFTFLIVPKYLTSLVLADQDTQTQLFDSWSYCIVCCSSISAIIVPAFTPYHSKMFNPGEPSHPRVFTAPITRWWTYSWITPFIMKSYYLDSNVALKDLPPLTPNSKPSAWLTRFRSVRSRCKSTTSALLRIFFPRLSIMAFTMLLCGLSEFLGAIGLRNLLLHLEGRHTVAIFNPWFSAVLFGVSPIIRGFFMQTFEFFSTDAICHLKSMTISVIYQRILSSRARERLEDGEVANLVSADIDKLSTMRYTIMATFMVPVEVLVASILLYQSLGWSCVPGLVILLLTRAPMSWYFSKIQGFAQSRVMASIDARMRRVSDVFKGLQSIKMLGQDQVFATWIGDRRQAELRALWHKWTTVALCEGVSNLFVLGPLIISLAMHTLVARKPLEPSVVFTVLSVFNTLQKMLSLSVIGASTYAQAMVSLARLAAFLEEDDMTAMTNWASETRSVHGDERVFGCANAAIDVKTNGGGTLNIVKNATVDLLPGRLNLVIGKTGSGKSTLVKALISELKLSSGKVSLRSHDSQPISYASQSPWLQRTTIRDNILFSSPFDARRYQSALQVTALDIDVKTLPSLDLTDVGEGGSLLSGGQKARIALARALYAPTQIIVLDDILSALDAKTSSFVVKHAIQGPLAKGRTIILVSEHAMCRAIADQIIELHQGEVKSITRKTEVGPETTLPRPMESPESQEGNTKATTPLPVTEEQVASDEYVPGQTAFLATSEAPAADMSSETVIRDRIGRLAVFKYLRLFGNTPTLLVFCMIILGSQGLDVASSLWLTIWSSNRSAVTSASFYLNIYCAIGISGVIVATSGALGFFRGTIRASRSLHSNMLLSLLNSTFSFITNTPKGQLVNRFSSDMFSLDNVLPELLKQVIENYLSIIFRLAAVSSVLPIFLLPATLVLSMGVFTGHVYIYGSTASKKLYAASFSSVLTSISGTVSGIEVIRAHRAQAYFEERFNAALSDYLRAWETLSASQRWLAVRMDFFAGMISFSTAALSMMLTKNDPSRVGFSMISSSALCTALLYSVYLASVLEVEMNSFQRVQQYIADIPQEANSRSQAETTPVDWPWKGNLEVENLSAGYSLDGEAVLENISFSAEPGRRIAIVGRSGSGKSSLVAAVLRLATRYRGTVKIDGIDTDSVSVRRLRQAVSFIPQDPVLFEGTLRFNVDFSGTIPDATLQTILAQVIPSGGEKDWSLDRLISSGGNNLSQGERQLIAMARALANDARIIIIDEATASLDPESDHRLQRLLRERFAHKALIAIAHRLNTIIDFDEVLVMDKGKVIERGRPQTLVDSGQGLFWEMWRASDNF